MWGRGVVRLPVVAAFFAGVLLTLTVFVTAFVIGQSTGFRQSSATATARAHVQSNLGTVVRLVSPTPSPSLTPLRTDTPTESPTVTPTVPPTLSATPTVLPTQTATSTKVVRRYLSTKPVGPVRIAPGKTFNVRLGAVQFATLVDATVYVDFDHHFGYVFGKPTIDVIMLQTNSRNVSNQPSNEVGRWDGVGNGFHLIWAAPRTATYTLVLSNSHSLINAMQVGVQFNGPTGSGN